MAAAENFRVNLRTAMRVRRITSLELAERIATKQPYISRVLNGHTEPGIGQCERLAKAVGFPLASLLGSIDDFSDAVASVETA